MNYLTSVRDIGSVLALYGIAYDLRGLDFGIPFSPFPYMGLS